MKAQVIVTPLPTGSKTNSTTNANYEQLLAANTNNVTETKWWNHFLEPLETKYNLVYRSGKSVFQIYYHQGKNMNANKEINTVVSNAVKKANTGWQEILKATVSFDNYRHEKLQDSINSIRQELGLIIKDQQNLNPESEEFKALSAKQTEVLENYKKTPLVEAVNKEYETYQEDLKNKIDEYLANDTVDFKKFIESLTFKNPIKEEVNE